MKKLLPLCFAGCFVIIAVSANPYTTKYDDIDLDKILTNERLLNGYFKCLMERGSCTGDGEELRKSLPDALANDCASCTEKQKNGSDKVIHFLMKHKPDMWTELQSKYDPEGKYKERLAQFAKEDPQETMT